MADEIHYFKTHTAQRTKALKKLNPKYKLGLTGTPMQNKPVDVHSIFEFLIPDYFGTLKDFRKKYVLFDYSKGYPISYRNLFELKKIVGKRMIRRKSDDLDEELTRGFKHYRYYFPEKQIPAVYSFLGGFNQSIVIADSVIAIGLDKYLGRNCEIYDKLGWEEYRQKNMYKEKIPTDCIKSWAKTEWLFNDSTDNVLYNMLYNGKLLYFTRAMYPKAHDTIIAGFTGKELEWCKANEKHMWEYLIDKNLLYSTDYMTINKMVNPAPFTSGFPRQSPGQAINWLGWQIIDTYMERKSGTDLKELMNESDYQKILSVSKYHP